MFYLIKNISDTDIIIGKGILKPGKVMKSFSVDNFNVLIEKRLVEIKYINGEDIKKENIDEVENNFCEDFIASNIKDKLIECMFDLYINHSIKDENFSFIKWFYSDVGLTNKVSSNTLNLLNNSKTGEDFITVLLNNVYPELFDLYLTQEKNKKNQ